MSDRLTQPHPPSAAPPTLTPRTPWLAVSLQLVVVVVAFGVVGAGCGLLWWHLWSPPSGVVADKQWFTSETGLREDFAATGLYVVIASVAGLVLGMVLSWFFDRSELVSLLAVTGGAVLAAWVMWRVGTSFSAADPHQLAEGVKNGTRLKGDLHVAQSTTPGPLRHRGLSVSTPFLSFPASALLGVGITYSLTSRRRRPEPD